MEQEHDMINIRYHILITAQAFNFVAFSVHGDFQAAYQLLPSGNFLILVPLIHFYPLLTSITATRATLSAPVSDSITSKQL